MPLNNDKNSTPPWSLDGERSVLGAMLLNPDAISTATEVLRGDPADIFFVDAHQYIFGAIVGLFNAGTPVDMVTVTEYLLHRERLEQAGGAAYIAELTDAVPTSANVEHYARIVLKAAQQRKLITLCTRCANSAYAHAPVPLAAELMADLKQVSTGRCRAQSPADFRAEHEAWLDAGGDIACLTTGIKALDHFVKCQDDFLWVIGARPKTGKTSFVIDLFARFATTGQGTGLFYSLEMAAPRILRKFHARVVPHDEYLKRVGESQYRPITIGDLMSEYKDELYSLPLKIVDDEHSIEGIMASARHEVAKDPDIKYLAIDYVEMITTTAKTSGTVEVINHALRSLVSLKKELRIPIFLVSQLRRKGDDFGAEPSMDELKGSGLIEQSADVMVLLWEPGMSDSDSRICGETYKKIAAKIIQRDGAHGAIRLQSYMPQSRFRDWCFGGMPSAPN